MINHHYWLVDWIGLMSFNLSLHSIHHHHQSSSSVHLLHPISFLLHPHLIHPITTIILSQLILHLLFHHPIPLNSIHQLNPPPSSSTISSIFHLNSTQLINSILLILDHLFLIYAISNLSILRLIILTTSSSTWSRSISDLLRALILRPLSNLTLIRPTHPTLDLASPGMVALLMLITCLTIDLNINPLGPSDLNRLKIGYLSLLSHLVINGFRITNLQLDKTVYRNQTSISLFASIISLLLSLISHLLFSSPQLHRTHQPHLGLLLGSSIIYSIVSHFSLTRLFHSDHHALSNQVLSRLIVGMITSELTGYLVFDLPIGNLADRLVALVSYLGISSIASSIPSFKISASSIHHRPSASLAALRSSPSTNPLERMAQLVSQTKSVLKTILSNSESRNIYFFLCLNLSFMFVQMMYGIWTNSLGLISDSIHMFFDCMALGMGLFASVMATWPPDEQFTYGYGRVETLSGFGNGIFLMLISIFIVFEAIQRLIDPPAMNTNQLLVVSFVGLLVNLVGMFATGHHHHHHHGHSHGHHDHDHGHSHNMKGVFLHVMADTLGSVGVIISTLLIERYGWTGFDPIASIFIAVLIFASVVPLVQDSARILMLSLDEQKEGEIRKALGKLSTVEGLSSYSAPRFWPKDPSTISGSIHLQLRPISLGSRSGSMESNGVGGGGGLTMMLEEEEQSPGGGSRRGVEYEERYDHVVDSVKKAVQDILAEHIPGLSELIIQVEAIDGSRNCTCLTSLNNHHPSSLTRRNVNASFQSDLSS